MIIWIASFPRSGNTLYRMIAHKLTGLPTWAAVSLALLLLAQGAEVSLRLVKRAMHIAYGTHAMGDAPFLIASAVTAILTAAFYVTIRRSDGGT